MEEATPKSAWVCISSYTGHRWLPLKSPLNFLKYFGLILKRLLQHNPPEPIKENETTHSLPTKQKSVLTEGQFKKPRQHTPSNQKQLSFTNLIFY